MNGSDLFLNGLSRFFLFLFLMPTAAITLIGITTTNIYDNTIYNEFLVIHNFSTSNLLTECIFYYTIVDYKKWKIIGHKMNKVIQEHLGNPNLIGVRKRLLTECEF
jgi:hypothetical protein